MKMVSMEKTKEEVKENKALDVGYEEEKYPYGLKLHLRDEDLEKLGIKELPKVGSSMEIMAKVEVCNASMYETKEGEEKCLGLQITEMAIGAPKKETSNILYGED